MANLLPGERVNGERYFLQLMVEELEKGYTPGSTFRKESQLYVNRKFRLQYGPIYSDRCLKAKLKSLKKKYKEFSELLNEDGFYWNTTHDFVYGPTHPALIEKYKKRYRKRANHYIGEYNWDLMRLVFESGVNFE